MKKTKKLWIAVFALAIALTMAATVFLAVGFAEGDAEGYELVDGNLGWRPSDHVTLSYNAATKTAKISGEGYINDFKAGQSYFYAGEGSTARLKDAETVIVEEGIISIADYMFYQAVNLQSITFPSTLGLIGEKAFEGCISLKSVDLPNGFRYLDHDAFKDCTSLETFHMPTAKGTIDCFSGCRALTEIAIPEGVTKLGDRYDFDFLWTHEHEIYHAFKGCFSLKKITFPSTLETIQEGSFDGCSFEEVIFSPEVTTIAPDFCHGYKDLTKVVLPDGLTSIGDYAFGGCENLSEIELPDSLVDIGSYAFGGCNNLPADLVIPDSVRTIGDGAFSGWKNLVEIEISDDVESFGYNAFEGCSSLRRIKLPNCFKGFPCFAGCASLTEIINLHPTDVEGIPYAALSGCSSLEKIKLPGGLKCIPYAAFKNCSSLKEIDFSVEEVSEVGVLRLPDGVESIEPEAFSGCAQFTSVFFPQSVTDIGEKAFYDCGNLETLTFCRNELTIGKDAFVRQEGYDIYSCYESMEAFLAHITVSVDDSNADPYEPFPARIWFGGSMHEVVYMPEQKATWTESGMKAHYECVKCGAMFEDAEGASEKPVSKYFIPRTGEGYFRMQDFFQRLRDFFRRVFEILHRMITH